MDQPKKTSVGVIIVGYLFFSCFGLGLVAAIGATGYPGVVLAVVSLAGCVALIAKVPRFRVPAIFGVLGSLLMMLIGFGSAMKAKDDAAASAALAEATRKQAAELEAQHTLATAKLNALPANAPAADVLSVCDEVEKAGDVPAAQAERCGAAFFAKGRELLASGKADEAAPLLESAAKNSAQKREQALSMVATIKAEQLRRDASDLLKDSQAKLASGEPASAIAAATAAQEKTREALTVKPDDKQAADLGARIQAQLDRAVKAQEKQAEAARQAEEKERQAQEKQARAKRREAYVKESCSQLSRLFGPESTLSDLQKDELWKQYKGKGFAWDLQVVEVSSGLLGGYTVQFKCARNSPSFIQDIQMNFPVTAKQLVLQLRKGGVYEVEGNLKSTSTLLGMTADPL